MQGDEIRALRRLWREHGPSSHVFVTERDGPMTPKAFHALFSRIGARAKMPFPTHPHMLRHGCGYALANAGHDTRALQAWLGHKNIQHTVRYTELAPIGSRISADRAAPRRREACREKDCDREAQCCGGKSSACEGIAFSGHVPPQISVEVVARSFHLRR
jgi:hypothetical protein